MPPTPTNRPYSTEESRWEAVRRRDPAADGHFFYAVSSTGVYCMPSCPSRTAIRENVTFSNDAAAAEKLGFRPCRRCRPDLPPKSQREAALVAEACRILEAEEEPCSLKSLAARFNLSPYHFQRLFRRVAGVSPKAYAMACREKRARERLRLGGRVTEAIYASGYASSSRFYEAAPGMLGMKPSVYGKGGRGERIWHDIARSTLGYVLVAATEAGVCAILLGDSREALLSDLQARFPRAAILGARPDFAVWVREAVACIDEDRRGTTTALPLDIRGTAFQRRVWEALREIPAGSTATYGDLARMIGRPRAVRAVANACAANPLAVAIPCHRAVAAGGSLAGYRWGIDRKRRLLEKESIPQPGIR